MYISQIELRNWKSYKDAKLSFPAPTSDANIVLIGAFNGYGKTSLFQAILLGMFGEDGMALIGGAVFSGLQTGREVSYTKFLEGALHRGVIGNGHSFCFIKLVFVDNNGESIEILRTWHFNDSGVYLPYDEEIQIYKGENRTPIGQSELSRQERKEWYRDYIARTFLPHNLASFFVFDGEQVRVLAALEMASQVRLGIEGLLGIPELRGLSKNLKDYAAQRQRNVPNLRDGNMNKVSNELKELSQSLIENQNQRIEISPKLSKCEEERKQLMEKFLALGVGSQTQSDPQYKRLAECESAIKDGNARLETILSQDIALSLAGAQLRKQLKFRLNSENIREQWLNGKQQGDHRIDSFLSTIDKAMDEIQPPINAKQQEEILSIARIAWEKLWFPPPANCADDYLHPYCSAYERSGVVDQLEALDHLGAADIVDLLDSISKNERRREQINNDIFRLERVAPDVNEERTRLKELDSKIKVLIKEDASLEREQKGLTGQLKAKYIESTRMLARLNDATPAIRRVGCAYAVAAMVDQIIGKAVPNQTAAIADEMTKAHKSMSHKEGWIDRIHINEECEVKLLNTAGEDVRRNGLSAGEEQIFTQSLFSAVSAVSKHAFPMVVDTPLARLDVEHRKGVLRHLSQLGRQVILLSTDTEVVNEYLTEIATNVQKKYRIDYIPVGDIGHSVVAEGYFENMGTKI